MSIYVAIGSGSPTIVSSNLGWSEFGDWVDGLPVAECGELVHFWEHGYADEVTDLADQLAAALKNYPPEEPDVVTVADKLASIIGMADPDGVLVVTDGVSDEAEEGEDDGGGD